ncbi:MAG: hypothetical protein JW957_05710 [Candidatus Omnitrophica bacterium]|nr:hypothetical protein [Candidatus Omnitrophota bacterium]
MGRNPAKVLIIVMLLFLAQGCSRSREPDNKADKPQEEITGFSLRQFAGDKSSFTLKGESAEISSGGRTTIAAPALSFSTGAEVIEINTGKEGQGEVKIVPDEKKVTAVVITGNVKIIYRDIKTGAVTMEGSCRKLTYKDAEKTLLMEGNPVIKRGKSVFSGDTVIYRFDENTLEIKGNVNAQIHTEKDAD